jgi:hypothetical protein
VKYSLLLFLLVSIFPAAVAQPGYSLDTLTFTVFDKDGNPATAAYQPFEVEWRNAGFSHNNWVKAITVNGAFTTERLRSDGFPTELKIYRCYGYDTMFVTCNRSLNHIPFKPGTFFLDESQCMLANMEPMNGLVILNKDWEFFRRDLAPPKKVLIKKRYFYLSKRNAFEENDLYVQYAGYNKSAHLNETSDWFSVYIELGKLYHAPQFSSAVYCIGYPANNKEADSGNNAFFMESADGCKSWKIKFPVPENTIGLVNMNENVFGFAISYPNNGLFTYSHTGKLLDSLVTEQNPCNWPDNMFYDCAGDAGQNHFDELETSNPFMDAGSFNHLFQTTFTDYDSNDQVRIETLPYSPKALLGSGDGGHHWKKILELNSNETYVYLTQRKNKLVLLSYHYTLVSTDFGKTWIFYANGSFTGGGWNFIWLDDNTLVNVTQYYADVMEIH